MVTCCAPDLWWWRVVRAIGAPISTTSSILKAAASGIGPLRSRHGCVHQQDIVLVGGGNSAGQAAVFLSDHAKKIHMVIRGGGLGSSMSRYFDRADRGDAEYRIGVQHRSRGARRHQGRFARAPAIAQPLVRRGKRPGYPQPVPVRRRRSRHPLAAGLWRSGSIAVALW